MPCRNRAVPVLIVLCGLIARLPVAAQRSNGSIVGVVTDTSGAVVPNAAITVTNIDTGTQRRAVTESTGNYRVVELLPGHYTVSAAMSGFTTEIREGITLEVDQDDRVDFSLRVGTTRTEVTTITAAAPLVNSENGSLGTVITNQQVNDLPSYQRNIFGTLPLLTPGVASGRTTYDNNPPIRLSVNGGRAFTQDVLLDGGSMLGVNINSWQNAPPVLDSVQEFKVQSNAYSAEFGRSTGVMNVVTKSGTNSFHGDIYDYLQNDVFDANYFFNNKNGSQIPRVRDELYGGTLGGPIKRSKVFFFMLYEGEQQRNPNNNLTSVPSTAFTKGDFSALLAQGVTIYDPATTTLNPAYDPSKTASASNPQYLRSPFAGNIIPTTRIDPVAAKAVAFFPAPNFGAPGAEVNNMWVSNSNPTSIWRISPRIDYNISDKNTLFVRFKADNTVSTSNGYWPTADPADAGKSTTHVPAIQGLLGDTYTLTPNLVNEFHGSYYRDATTTSYPSSNQNYAGQLGLPNSNNESFPVFNFGVPLAGYGLGPSNNLNQWEGTTEVSDIMTWLDAGHSIKWGVNWRSGYVNKRTGRGDPSGSFGFNGGYTSDIYSNNGTAGMADFLLGMPSSYTITPETFVWGARRKEFSWFVEDDWKITRNFTLNLGVRQDMEFSWHEDHNRYAAFSPTVINPADGLPGGLIFGVKQVNGNQLGNFAPRLGFAWSPFGNQKTVIRAGSGFFYSPASTIIDYGDTGQGEENGYVAHASVNSLDRVTPLFYLQNGGPPAVLPALTPAIANRQTMLWIPPGQKTPLTYSWNFTISQQLPGEILLEASYVGTRGIHLPFERYIDQVPANELGPVNYTRLLPYPQFTNVKAEFHDSVSLYNGFQLKLEKRYSQGLAWTLAYTLAKAMDNSSLDETTAWGGATWGGSGVQNIYDTRSNWAPSYFDERQKLAGSFTYELPFGPGKPYLSKGVAGKLLGGWQFNTIVSAHSGTPLEFLMSDNNSYSNSPTWRPNCIGNPGTSNPTINQWFNPTAFVAPAVATFGNCGRDLYHGPGFFDTDMSLFKNTRFKTPLNENTNLQIRLEAFNTTNRANFGLPNASVPACATSAAAWNQGCLNNLGAFGTITSTVGNPRVAQVALKLIF